MDSKMINNVILYLNSKKSYEAFEWLQRTGNNGTYVEGLDVIIVELNRLKLIEVKIDPPNKRFYLLNLKARNAIKTLSDEFSNRPYEYFFEEDKKETDSENLHKWYNREDAKQRFDDYPKIKRQRNIAAIIAIITAILSIVLGIKELISK